MLFLGVIWGLVALVPYSWIKQVNLVGLPYLEVTLLGCFLQYRFSAWNGHCSVVLEDDLWLAASVSSSHTCVMDLV